MNDRLILAPFNIEVTPPIGHSLCGGLLPPATTCRDPLWARGLIIDDGVTRVVLCVIDFCAIDGRAHRQACEALAMGANTSASRVALHTVHQHDAPYVISEPESELQRHGIGQLDQTWWNDVLRRLQDGTVNVHYREFTEIGIGSARVKKCASNRRMLDENGKVFTTRFSLCEDRKIKALPIGLIDPMLKSVTFWNESQLVASMNFYAVHPQSAHGRGTISADCIGEALRLTTERYPGAQHLYFTGCAGNITLGKYSTTDPELNIRRFGQRIADGISEAVEKSKNRRSREKNLYWESRAINLPLSIRISKKQARTILESGKANLPEKVGAAWALAAHNTSNWNCVAVQTLSFAEATVLFLPGEPFIEYQLHALKKHPRRFIAVAAYGDGKMFYVPTARAFSEGGYELMPTRCYTTCDAEDSLKNQIDGALMRSKR